MPEVFKGILHVTIKGTYSTNFPRVVRKKIEDFMQSEGCI